MFTCEETSNWVWKFKLETWNISKPWIGYFGCFAGRSIILQNLVWPCQPPQFSSMLLQSVANKPQRKKTNNGNGLHDLNSALLWKLTLLASGLHWTRRSRMHVHRIPAQAMKPWIGIVSYAFCLQLRIKNHNKIKIRSESKGKTPPTTEWECTTETLGRRL